MIGLLFVLLAADVRHADAVGLGGLGLLTVAALIFLVRPLNILVCTIRSGMDWREKTFLAWLAPRGIVAAAVATLFDERLTAAGIMGGQEMRALVFLVIAVTVLIQGTTGGFLAGFLGLRRPSGRGYAILGAHPLARALGRLLLDAKEDVVLIDADARLCTEAEKEGFRVIYGNALDERVLRASGLESRKAAVGLVFNEATNLPLRQQVPGPSGPPGLRGHPDRCRGGRTRDGPGNRRPGPLREGDGPRALVRPAPPRGRGPGDLDTGRPG